VTSFVRRQRPLAPVAAAAIVVVLIEVLTGCGGGSTSHAKSETTHPPVSSVPSPSPSHFSLPKRASLIATATTTKVAVRGSPSGPLHWSLANPNSIGAPLVFHVVGQRGLWWKVQLPARPNGVLGWVSASDVNIEVDPYSVVASLSKHMLTVADAGQVVMRLRIGVGRPTAPTPTGKFYLTELLQARNPHGAYGPYAYGTSAFSDVFSEFEGGPGQIGVHGTNDPSSIGRNVSHGCIRLHNADMARLAGVVPAGTPLTITP
jgi:lipoprotein-anchoring transpeptidase ErfK/SrfK